MARTLLAVQTPTSAGLNATYTAAIADGHAFDNGSGNVVLHVKNGGAGAVVVTIDIPKTVDGQAVTDKSISIAAGGERFIGPFPESIYNQDDSAGTGIEEAVFVNTDVQTSVTYAALKVSALH